MGYNDYFYICSIPFHFLMYLFLSFLIDSVIRAKLRKGYIARKSSSDIRNINSQIWVASITSDNAIFIILSITSPASHFIK